jgi:hypothetical protein
LVQFYEGNTISYAVNSSDSPLTKLNYLCPFTPFAWAFENVSPPRPFILFYDPKFSSHSFSPGPIVLHGGFTSAFYEFRDDKYATGRLIISIACWLTRIEERLYASKRYSLPLQKNIPKLSGSYAVIGTFTDWRPIPMRSCLRHSILILDGSGSMNSSYAKLIIAANKYIDIQVQRKGIISVISFSSDASILYKQETRKLDPMEGFANGGTDFYYLLSLAVQIASQNRSGYQCRILFFTDGNPNGSDYSTILNQLRSMSIRMDVVGFGSLNETVLRSLALNGGTFSNETTMDDVEKEFIRIAATD